MANELQALRYITWPPIPGTGGNETIYTDFLYYKPNFPATLHVYDDPSVKGFITKSFEPGDLTPQIEILDDDLNSPAYNKFRINDYVEAGIFNRMTIPSTRTLPGSAEAPAPLTDWSIYTVDTVVPADYLSNNVTWIVDNYIRGTKYAWIQRDQNIGTTFSVHVLDVVSKVKTEYTIVDPQTDFQNHGLLIVINSALEPVVIEYMSSEADTLRITSCSGTVLTFPTQRKNIPGLGYSSPINAVIDASDNIYVAVRSQGIYKFGSPVTQQIDFVNTPFTTYSYMTYNIYNNSFLLVRNSSTVEVDLSSTVLNDFNTRGDEWLNIGGYKGLYSLSSRSNDGPSTIYIQDWAADGSGPIGQQAFWPLNYTISDMSYWDGPSTSDWAGISALERSVNAYDCKYDNIYFVDNAARNRFAEFVYTAQNDGTHRTLNLPVQFDFSQNSFGNIWIDTPNGEIVTSVTIDYLGLDTSNNPSYSGTVIVTPTVTINSPVGGSMFNSGIIIESTLHYATDNWVDAKFRFTIVTNQRIFTQELAQTLSIFPPA